jgi:ADP-heptose:LPS heptosyltransferase
MKILLIRLSSLGDVVVTTPVARWVKNQMHAEVHFLTKQNYTEVYCANPYVDRVIAIETVIRTDGLKSEKYDYIIDLQKSLKSRKICRDLHASAITFDKKNVQKWVYTYLKINLLPKEHLVDRYARALEKINVYNDGLGLDFFIDAEKVIDQKLPQNYNVIVLGAAHPTKQMTMDLVQKIIDHSDQFVVLLGGKDVESRSSTFSENTKLINLCGKTNLHTSASILRDAKEIYTGDTGLMHISTALKKQVHLFWGSTSPIFGLYAYYGEKSEIKSIDHQIDLWCRPCTKIGRSFCPLGHYKCMNHQWPQPTT